MEGRVHGAGWVLCTLLFVFLGIQLLPGRGRARGPPLHGHGGWLVGRGVPMAQLERVPRGQQEPSPYPNG